MEKRTKFIAWKSNFNPKNAQICLTRRKYTEISIYDNSMPVEHEATVKRTCSSLGHLFAITLHQ